jgi:hypothetical protein
MKIKPALIVLLAIASISAKAQNLIAVQHAGSPKFYTKLPEAISGAMEGDTVYIPGGSFEAITIDKPLHLIGAGHNPDSTSTTARTVVSTISLTTGADGGSITGVQTGTIYISGTVHNYTIVRCNFSITTIGTVDLTNLSIIESIAYSFNLPGSNHTIANNIIRGYISANYSTIKNNIFLFAPQAAGVPYALNASYSIIENNIAEQYAVSGAYFNGCIFHNNVDLGANGISGTNQGSGNFETSLLLKNIVISYGQAINEVDGIYKDNFRLIADSPYKNAGNDGTDIGIFGGAFPWKEGSVPFNPHFQSLKIAPKTDASGNLKVQITVAAQNN